MCGLEVYLIFIHKYSGAFSFVTPSELVRHLGNTRVDSNILRMR